jgi:hypothetical protein
MSFTDKMYMMIESQPPLPLLQLEEPILSIKRQKAKYLSDYHIKKNDIRMYFKTNVFSLIKR